FGAADDPIKQRQEISIQPLTLAIEKQDIGVVDKDDRRGIEFRQCKRRFHRSKKPAAAAIGIGVIVKREKFSAHSTSQRTANTRFACTRWSMQNDSTFRLKTKFCSELHVFQWEQEVTFQCLYKFLRAVE